MILHVMQETKKIPKKCYVFDKVPRKNVEYWNLFAEDFIFVKGKTICALLDTIEDMELSSKSRFEYYKGWSEIYQDVGFELGDDSTLITGMDITIGLYSKTPSFRY